MIAIFWSHLRLASLSVHVLVMYSYFIWETDRNGLTRTPLYAICVSHIAIEHSVLLGFLGTRYSREQNPRLPVVVWYLPC
jgi:hypothetical protein